MPTRTSSSTTTPRAIAQCQLAHQLNLLMLSVTKLKVTAHVKIPKRTPFPLATPRSRAVRLSEVRATRQERPNQDSATGVKCLSASETCSKGQGPCGYSCGKSRMTFLGIYT